MVKTLSANTNNIQTTSLLNLIEQIDRSGDIVRFRYEGDGLRLITNEDTVINDWVPGQVEKALRTLEASGKIALTHIEDSQIEVYPLSEWRRLPPEEFTSLIKTDDELCTKVIYDIFGELDVLGDDWSQIPDYRIFQEMAQGILTLAGLTPRQLAICRVPDENGKPRLSKFIENVDRQIWSMIALETVKSLEKEGILTFQREGPLMTVTGPSLGGGTLILGEEEAFALQRM